MTRLHSQDIYYIGSSLKEYNKSLADRTGCSLGQIAAYAAGAREEDICARAARIAVIPFTCGQGVIEGFAHTVRDIACFLGFDAFVTESSDAAGLAEALEKGAGVLMMADDQRFIAYNTATGKVSDNAVATGKGYVAALDLMTGGIKSKKILLVGAGPVGMSAAFEMAGHQARIYVYDINPAAGYELASEVFLKYGCHVRVEAELEPALLEHEIIFDACPARAYIEKRHITDDTFIAAPGVPLGVSEDCLPQVYLRMLHDPLQIGVATMIFDVFQLEKNNFLTKTGVVGI